MISERTIRCFAAISLVMIFGALCTAQVVTPGGTITAVDAKTGVATAKVNSTGQVFTFTLADKALLNRVRPGQGVFVNLGKKQVSLDGKSTSGTIVTLFPIGTKPVASAGSGSSSGSGSSGSSTNSGSTSASSFSPPPLCSNSGGTSCGQFR